MWALSLERLGWLYVTVGGTPSSSTSSDLWRAFCVIAIRYYHTKAGYNVSLGMEACVSAGTCTQEDALKAVQADFVARKIPIRYMRTFLPYVPTWYFHCFGILCGLWGSQAGMLVFGCWVRQLIDSLSTVYSFGVISICTTDGILP